MDLSSVLAIIGVIGTVALLVLNLRVNGAMSDLKTDLQLVRTEVAVQISDTKLSVEKLRGDFYQEHIKFYGQIMNASAGQYMNKETSLEMHTANLERFEKLDKRLDELTTRVGDIS